MDLTTLFQVIDEASPPDVGHEYFIHSTSTVAQHFGFGVRQVGERHFTLALPPTTPDGSSTRSSAAVSGRCGRRSRTR